jgi:hypothetical protein
LAFDAAVRRACNGDAASRAKVTEAMARQVWAILRANGWNADQATAQAGGMIADALAAARQAPWSFSAVLWVRVSKADGKDARVPFARDVFQRQFLPDLPPDLRWFQESTLRDETDAEFKTSLSVRGLSDEQWETGLGKARQALRALMLSLRDDELRARTHDYWSHSSVRELLG